MVNQLSFTEAADILRSERSYVGALINGDARMEDCVLKANDFADPLCRSVFKALAALHAAGESTDYATLCYKHEELDLREVTAMTGEAKVDAAIIRRLEGNIRDASNRRSARALLMRAFDLLADKNHPLEETIGMTGAALARFSAQMVPQDVIAGDDALVAFHRWLCEEKAEEGRSTGLAGLDKALGGGIRGGRLVVVGARPGVGKSALLSFIATDALEKGRRVLYVSLEMGAQEVMLRMVAKSCAVGCDRMQSKALTPQEEEAVVTAYEMLGGRNLSIATGADTVGAIRREALRMRAAGGIDLVCVDYLQLMQGAGKAGSRAEAVGEISRGLKLLAMELDCPVIAASQVNRASTYGEERAPRLSELRESGSIEQDADVVLLLHSPANSKKGAARRVQLAVAKNRQGKREEMDLTFVGATMRFCE